MKKLFAEALGTMVLVLTGCGVAVLNGGPATVAAVLTIAFAFGLSVLCMVYTIGNISGCHINPAITLGMWLSGRMTGKEAGGYMLAQLVGAFAGSSILYIITSQMGLDGTGANSYREGEILAAFIAETFFTFVFVLVVMRVTYPGNNASNALGVAIGLALVICHLFCIPITGTSVNPARSIAPAFFAGPQAISQLWLFITAPFTGGAIAAYVWKVLNKE